MKSYTVTLNSIAPYGIPQVLDGGNYWNPLYPSDPTGSNGLFVYPLTADGDANSTPGFFPTDTYTGALTADDENIVPWGYLIQDIIVSIPVGPLKGPYTITFDPTGLDTSSVDIMKIVYNFGDGTPEITVNNEVIVQNFTQGESLTATSPSGHIITHDYYPQSNTTITTFNPSITAYYTNIARWIYNISISSVPLSIYEFDDIHLISNTQQLTSTETQNVFEVETPDYLTVARVVSSVDTKYSTAIPFDPNESILNYDLITWLDASDSTTISKDSNNKVWVWFDKSSYKNNYFNDSNNLYGQPTINSPTFLYGRQSQSGRKCVHFKTNLIDSSQNQYLYALASGALGDRVLYTYNQGFTVVAVMKLNQIGPHDTLFAYDLNTNENGLQGTNFTPLQQLGQGNGNNYLPFLNVSFASDNSMVIEQGDTSYYYGTSSYDPNNGLYQPVSTGTISQNLTSYSLFTYTASGNAVGTAYFTADTAIIQRKQVSFQNSYTTIDYFLSGGFNQSTQTTILTGNYDPYLVYGLLGTSDAYPDSYLTDAEISEFMLFDRPLNPDEIASVQAYLVNKWGLTLQTN